MSFGIRGRLFVLALISASCVIALAYVAWSALDESKIFSSRYNAHVADMDFKADTLPPPACAMEVYLATHQYGDFDPADRPKLKVKMEALITAYETQWKRWVESETDPAQRSRLEVTRDLGREEIASIKAFMGQVDANVDEAAREATLAVVEEKYQKHLAAIQETLTFVEKRMKDREQEMLGISQMASLELLYGSLFIVLVVMGGSWLIARSIIRPVTQVVTQLSAGAEQVNSASSEVSAGAQRIAQGASQQAASLEETTASLEELSATCSQNANNARQANALASDAANASESGENAARRAASEVTTQMQELAKAIDAIRASTEKTTQVVESIDDIAIQINLLALNAAVEAARAGEAGLGFAVVADEVRNLAARSTEEAKNTSALIREARANTERVHEVSRQVQEYLGRTLNQDVVGNFQKLVTMVRKVAQLSAEVAAASDEQSRGVGQINAAVAQMDKVTQENAASAEESAASSEEMQAQAVSLREGVSHLREVVGVTAEPTGAAVHAPVVHPTMALVRLAAKSVSANGNGMHRPVAAKSAAEVMPLTDDEAREHKGDFSRF